MDEKEKILKGMSIRDRYKIAKIERKQKKLVRRIVMPYKQLTADYNRDIEKLFAKGVSRGNLDALVEGASVLTKNLSENLMTLVQVIEESRNDSLYKNKYLYN